MVVLIKYLAFDPGEATGVAAYDENAQLLWLQTVSFDRLTFVIMQLELENCTHFIIEGYKVYPQEAEKHIYSDLKTAQAIGKLKTIAEIHSIKVVIQGADKKATGYKFLGMAQPKKHDPLRHQKDAHSHFTLWAVKTGRINPATLVRR